jgi:hypothetical protein
VAAARLPVVASHSVYHQPLDHVKQGDNVRASFDPSTHKATSLEVKSKGSAKARDDSQKSQK